MGDMAEMMLDGTLDANGEYIDGKSPGYPRPYGNRKPYKKLFKNKKTNKSLNGILKYLANKDPDLNESKASKIILNYAKNELGIDGSLNFCAVEIQKDFGKFIRHLRKTT